MAQSQIFLIGFMACGKSTVGTVLAEALDRPFVDLDVEIEANVGCTIAELVAREGEERFRQIETEMLRMAAQGDPAVIAPGGGAVTRTENCELMLHFGKTIWLDAPFELCWERIRRDQVVRPLAPDEATARARYAERLPLYRQAAIRVTIGQPQNPSEIAAVIISRFPIVTHSGTE